MPELDGPRGGTEPAGESHRRGLYRRLSDNEEIRRGCTHRPRIARISSLDTNNYVPRSMRSEKMRASRAQAGNLPSHRCPYWDDASCSMLRIAAPSSRGEWMRKTLPARARVR